MSAVAEARQARGRGERKKRERGWARGMVGGCRNEEWEREVHVSEEEGWSVVRWGGAVFSRI